MPAATVIVVMGVAGCGKTSVGQALAGALGLPFLDGDDLHPPRNVALMASGQPLGDEDRREWLDAIAGRLAAGAEDRGLVVACSALKRVYRDRLRAGHALVRFVHLAGPRDVMARRLANRKGHFMPVTLIDSQFAALEPPGADEGTLTVDASLPLDNIVTALASQFSGDAQ